MNHPLLLELNTRCWLRELSVREGRRVALDSVPDRAFAEWVEWGITHLWLMGVWSTGPRSRARALAHPSLLREYDRVLPGWQEEDVAGSPYAIACYTVPETLGGMKGLSDFRHRLHEHGLKLILDFVPNHVGLDHPWIDERPEYLVQSETKHPSAFHRGTGDDVHWIAHGKDPHFAPWDDTAQLDYRRADVHEAMRAELLRIAELCDGVRCDMAMLLLSDVFEKTWKNFPLPDRSTTRATAEFWKEAIANVKAAHPGFLLLAEVYWDMEERLQELGFLYTYDKSLTDALLRGQSSEALRQLQGRSADYVSRSAHFLENHDEERVGSVLSLEEHRAAALAVLAMPGLRFLHEGQTDGAVLRTPVQLGRRQSEPVVPEVRELYVRVFEALRAAGVGCGTGRVLRAQPAWAGNPTFEHILVIRWGSAESRFALVVVNLSRQQGQCRIPLGSLPSENSRWQFTDLLGDERWIRPAAELNDPGLFLDVTGHAAQVFRIEPDGEHHRR